jgi:DNA polymerase-4
VALAVDVSTLCRDCATALPDGAVLCAHCGGARLVRHAELFSLAIAHIDCDAFYASVEKRDRPELAAQPVIVAAQCRCSRR